MGQRSNLLTINRSNLTLNLISIPQKLWSTYFLFLKYFKFLLKQKGVSLINEVLNTCGNKCYFSAELFYSSTKIIVYKKKIKPIISFLKVNTKYKTVTNLFFKCFKQLKINNILFSFKNLNLSVSNQLIVFFYNKFKKFITTIFQRRFHLFIDFLKLTCLFYNNLISSHTYLLIFAQIFKFIAKRLHTQFIAFLKTVFKTLIVDILLLPLSYITPFKIVGIKFVINGKLQGKTRASSIIVEEGLTPGQSISKKIQFSKIHIYTLLGAFGFKFWIHKNL